LATEQSQPLNNPGVAEKMDERVGGTAPMEAFTELQTIVLAAA
jgi:hypothetical protein